MTLEQVIQEIQSKLTGDKKKDIDFLFQTLDSYDNSPFSKELYLKIADMMADMLKDCSPKEIAVLTDYIRSQSTRKYNEKLLRVKDLISQNHLDDAMNIIHELEKQVQESIQEAKDSYSDQVLTFRYYFSFMESVLGEKYFPAENIVSLPFDYVSLLTMKAQIYYAKADDQNAYLALHTALEYDPVSPDLPFLMSDIDSNAQNYLSYKMNIQKAKRFLFRVEDFQRYLACVSNYFTKAQEDPSVESGIKAAVGKAKRSIPLQLRQKLNDPTKETLQEEGFEWTLSEEVVSTLIEEYKNALKKKDKYSTDYFGNILIQYYTKDEILNLVNQAE